MSFTASSPAPVSVTLDVVDDRSMCSVSPWNFTPQPFGLSQSPSSVVATAGSSEAADDNLVVVKAPAVETPVVERLFLDDEKEIEFLGQKGPSNTEVESEVDEPVHDPWSADKVKAAGWSTAGWEPQPIELVDVHNLGVCIDDRGSNQWLKTLTIEDKLDTATLTLNAIQPKIQRLQRDLQRDLQHNTAVCAFGYYFCLWFLTLF